MREPSNHLAFQPDLERCIPVMLAVSRINRHHGMHKLMHQHGENLFRFRQVRANEYLEMLIGGR